MRDPELVPSGLVLFVPGTPPSHRRRRLIFIGIFAAACIALLWPVYSLVAGPAPFVLGLPLSLAWLVLWLLIISGSLLWLYRSEPARSRDSSS